MPSGSSSASSDDAALVWRDGFTSIIAPEDGKYIIQVRESAYAGNGGCLYRLHVGNFPRATAVMPAGGKPGETLAVRWIGDPAGEATTTVTLPATFEREFGLHAPGRQGSFALSQHLPADAARQRDREGAQRRPGPRHAVRRPRWPSTASSSKPGDVDQFVFKATKGQVFDIHCYARRIRSPLDSVMYLGKKGAGAMLGADDAIGPDSYFRFQAPENAEYVIWLVDHLGKGGPDYAYRIEVTPVVPQLMMTTNAEQIPLGTGRHVDRRAQGEPPGDLDLRQPGRLRRRAECRRRRAAGRRERRGADDGRQPGGRAGALLGQARRPAGRRRWPRSRGKPVDPKLKCPFASSSRPRSWCYGQNNVNVWSRTVDRLAVAVTEECPYTIEIVEPKVPLVRGGSMGLKVRAIRKPGFKAAIAVYLPWNPPGVGSAGGIAIPEGRTRRSSP